MVDCFYGDAGALPMGWPAKLQPRTAPGWSDCVQGKGAYMLDVSMLTRNDQLRDSVGPFKLLKVVHASIHQRFIRRQVASREERRIQEVEAHIGKAVDSQVPDGTSKGW